VPDRLNFFSTRLDALLLTFCRAAAEEAEAFLFFLWIFTPVLAGCTLSAARLGGAVADAATNAAWAAPALTLACNAGVVWRCLACQ
jgi:hypothetical protein